MKKILLIMFLFISFIGLLGCENKNCLVTFSIDSEEQIIEINKGTILNYNLVTSYEEDVIEGLYYDENYTLKYDYKEIKDDITIYVKTKKVEVTFVIVHEYKKVLINKNSQITKEVLSKVVDTNLIEGLYYDPLYTNKYNNELIIEETTLYLDLNMDKIERVGNIYTLEEAYNNNYLNIEDIKYIKNNISEYCDNKKTYANIIDGIYPCEWISEDLIRQIVFDKETQLNPDCDGCLEFELIKQYFIYFGTYNDCIVFRAEGCGLRVGTDWGAKIFIEDIWITIPEGPYIYVWKPFESNK